jgi:hypothetical protein
MFKAMMGDAEFSESTPQYRLDPSFPLEIEREHLVKQTLEIIKKANPKDIRKRLQVSFKGEPGLVLMLVVSPRRSVHKALP